MTNLDAPPPALNWNQNYTVVWLGRPRLGLHKAGPTDSTERSTSLKPIIPYCYHCTYLLASH